MKLHAISLILFCCALSLRADNPIQNGDFSDGITHWHGGGRSPADFASDNPMQASDPFTSKGLIIPLKSSSWTKVAQDFKGKVSTGILTVTYMVSKDFAFSDKAEDYKNMPDHIGYDGWKAFDTPPGDWIIFLTDFGSARGTYYELKGNTGSSNPVTVRLPVKGLTPMEGKTITLGFPPGTGTLVVLSIDLEPK